MKLLIHKLRTVLVKNGARSSGTAPLSMSMHGWACFEVQDFNLQAYVIGKYGMNFLCLISHWNQGGWEGNNELWTITTIVTGFLEGGSVHNSIVNLPSNFVFNFFVMDVHAVYCFSLFCCCPIVEFST